MTKSVRNKSRLRGKRDSISDMAFRARYLRRSRQIYNRYLESKPWINQLYTSFFKFEPGQKIVDVGCGLGDFTRFLARLSNGKAKILGIDSNPKSIKAAEADTKKAGLSNAISYKLGDVYKLPIGDKNADLTCCRTLLMHLPDPLKAVKEMARITKIGGSVVAVEGGRMVGFHHPNDEAYNKAAKQAYEAYMEGVNKLEGKTFGIGEKLPEIFQKAGLSGIKADIHADAWTYTDPRRKLSDIKDEVRFDYATFKERRRRDRKYLIAGGMSGTKISRYFDRLEAKTKSLLANDHTLRNDTTLYAGVSFLVSGTRKN